MLSLPGLASHDNREDDIDRDGSSLRERKHKARFSRIAVKTLREWFKAHADDPYPTEDDKQSLAALTGLQIDQVNTWFANTRRRKNAKKRADAAIVTALTTHHNLGHVKNTAHRSLSGEPNEAVLPGTISACHDLASTNGHCSDAFATNWAERIYQCTFCTDAFKTKYDWNRHETSLHLSLKRYVCCPASPVLTDALTNTKSCAYCKALDPSDDHIESHNHSQCQEREPEARTFFRKDHLRQHVQSVHACPLLPHMNAWALEAKFINSRCGFCGQRFSMWAERNDHISAHFRDGLRMDRWKGCRGFDPAISAVVTSAMPPFLIGIERLKPHPYSASRKKTSTSLGDFGAESDVSSWEMLAVQLHHLTERCSKEGSAVSDETLKRHARMVSYGAPDARGLTAADSPEWLDLFKRAHSLGMIASDVGNRVSFIEDSEAYDDLGIRKPSSVRQQQMTFTAMFLADQPPEKKYPRFSSLSIPPERALRFETITGPWPDSGILGQLIFTSDWLFSLVIQSEIGSALCASPSLALEGEAESWNDVEALSVAHDNSPDYESFIPDWAYIVSDVPLDGVLTTQSDP